MQLYLNKKFLNYPVGLIIVSYQLQGLRTFLSERGERKLGVGILRRRRGRNSWFSQVGTFSHIDHKPPISRGAVMAAKPRTSWTLSGDVCSSATSQTTVVSGILIFWRSVQYCLRIIVEVEVGLSFIQALGPSIGYCWLCSNLQNMYYVLQNSAFQQKRLSRVALSSLVVVSHW